MLGMNEIAGLLERWRMDAGDLRRRMYQAPTPRERERWHALWLLHQGWTASAVADALERDPHTIGLGSVPLERAAPRRYSLSSREVPSALSGEQQFDWKAAVQELPAQAGIDLANWKVVRRFVQDRFGLALSRSSCLNYLHRLGFVLKQPKKRLVKADPVRREAFVSEYAALTAAARRTGAKIFFADEAHFRADADLRGKWVLQGEPALVDSTSPRRGEKASYYSAVCLETGEVEVMELEGNSNSATSAAFLRQLRARHYEPLTVIWDNSPAHRGDALRAYLATSDSNLCLVNLPSYSPDFNADEAIWGWVRQEATANLCLGTRTAVQEKVGDFFARLSTRREEVKRRWRTVLQAQVAELMASNQTDLQRPAIADFTLASV